METVNNIEDVAIEIRRAILVLKSLPKVGPRRLRAYWPEFATEEKKHMAKYEYFRPLPDEIDDMDIVLEQWLNLLDLEDKRLVYLRGEGRSWKYLQAMYKMSRSAIYQRYLRCLKKILAYVLREQNRNNTLQNMESIHDIL